MSEQQYFEIVNKLDRVIELLEKGTAEELRVSGRDLVNWIERNKPKAVLFTTPPHDKINDSQF